jgi:hypothetical protein
MKWRLKSSRTNTNTSSGQPAAATDTGWSSPADLRRVYPGGAMRVIDRGRGADLPASADDRPAAVVLPGLSLLERDLLTPDQVLIRCPGCGAWQIVSLQPGGPPFRPAFQHRSGNCPIQRRIEAAIAMEQAVLAAAERP